MASVSLFRPPAPGATLKRNYQFEKRQKELEKKRKKELKQQKQLERANRPEGSEDSAEAAPEDTTLDG